MDHLSLKDCFYNLHSVILKEREAAKTLEIDELFSLTHEKEELLQRIDDISDEYTLDKEDRLLVESIQTENRRNAYFFLSVLNWVRQAMQFWNGKLDSQSYEKTGNMVNSNLAGKILSGKV